MKHFLRITILSLLALLFSSCLFSGLPPQRTLGHVYQDSEGFHILTLIESGTGVNGTARIVDKNDSDRPLLVSVGEFDRMWSTFDKEALASYKRPKDAGRFNAADNYVITIGYVRKGGTDTYVIPHSEAHASLKRWVDEFRSKSEN